MTLARKAWSIDIENVTQGWSYSVTQGDVPDPDDPVQLADGFEHNWQFADAKFPGRLDPSTCSFGLLALTAADMPGIRRGDVVVVDLVRPLVVGTASYLRFAGRIVDATMTLDPSQKYKAQARITCVDFMADLAANRPPPITYPVWSELLWDRVIIDYNPVAKINLRADDLFADEGITHPYLGPFPEVPVDEFLTSMFYGYPIDGNIAAVRPAHGIAAGSGSWQESNLGPDPDIAYYTQFVKPIIPAGAALPFQLVADSGLAVLEVKSDATDDTGIACMDAAYVTVPVQARKSAENATNSIIITGYQLLVNEPVDLDGIADRTYQLSLDVANEYGQVPRQLDTQYAYDVYLPEPEVPVGRGLYPAAEVFLPDATAAVAPWSYDQVDVHPDLMTDDALDLHASQFYPPVSAADHDLIPRTVVVIDVDEDVLIDPTPPAIVGATLGCKHAIVGGELTITPQLLATVLPNETGSNAVTSAQIAASGTLATTKLNGPGLHIDPNITFADLRLTTI